MGKSKADGQADFIRKRRSSVNNYGLLAVILGHYYFTFIEESLNMIHRKLVNMK
ncbi:hypothetical protein D3C80_2183460 [compost metagenome]